MMTVQHDYRVPAGHTLVLEDCPTCLAIRYIIGVARRDSVDRIWAALRESDLIAFDDEPWAHIVNGILEGERDR